MSNVIEIKKYKTALTSVSVVLALSVIVSMPVSFSGCTRNNSNGEVIYENIDPADAVEHSDYTSVYEAIGSNITIDMVEENEDGIAFVTYEGVSYELGMDFLSMAMVYNVSVPEGSEYTSSEDVYNKWWKLYVQRWNYLVPEIPLYSNRYFDIYNAKIENFETTPYWSAANAIVEARVKDGNANSVILGSATELSGSFRNAGWGKSEPGSSDLDVQELTSGHATVMTDRTGTYIWNMGALAEEPKGTVNEDGTLTYTLKIKKDLVFSDGSSITAKNYVAAVLANSTAVGVAAGGSGQSGLYYIGFDKFKAYEGGDNAETVYFEGIKLLDDYTFSVTIEEAYAGYYYAIGYALFSPEPLALYLGDAEIITDGNGSCGLSAEFYRKQTKNGTENYVTAEAIKKNLSWDSGLPYSGPYTVTNYDASSLVATLTLNTYYTGDTARGKPSIKTLTFVKTIAETQLDQFTSGQVDVIEGVTGASETKAALAVVEQGGGKYAETHYDRAGYGKIGFRADFGPTGFIEVRQAIMYSINRDEFAQTFTGGFGTVVHGPYYTGFPTYTAVKDELLVNTYASSYDSARTVLEEGGWVYNEKGGEYNENTDAVRYKKLEGYELSAENLSFSTTDGAYKTVKINGEYYMPLAINYYGTQPNGVTDQLLITWAQNDTLKKALGMYIVYTSTDFSTGIYGELIRMEAYGYNGVPKLNAVNFATGFSSAIYDYSFNWTINPSYYDTYSSCYVMDEADFMENYS